MKRGAPGFVAVRAMGLPTTSVFERAWLPLDSRTDAVGEQIEIVNKATKRFHRARREGMNDGSR